MSNSKNPIEFLFDHDPGKSILAKVDDEQEELEQQCVLSRLPSEAVDSIPENPGIELRSDAFIRDGVGCVPLLIRIETEEESITLETWIDICDGYPQRKDPLLDLRKQEVLPILLYTEERTPERILYAPNVIDWNEIEDKMPHLLWSPEDYQKAQKKITDQYPNIYSLWRALKDRP